MRNFTLNINREDALEGLRLMDEFHKIYLEKHGMDYLQAHYREYEAERSEYIKAHRA